MKYTLVFIELGSVNGSFPSEGFSDIYTFDMFLQFLHDIFSDTNLATLPCSLDKMRCDPCSEWHEAIVSKAGSPSEGGDPNKTITERNI